ncbi:uncharacterized protein N7496_008521 [Penicillium cataractarum]|uniref:Uncharacterized protein n=1 Tax=Penicillium cataractarum TaxID=2100454 RepID=A0A9W9RYL2_9EURO|nr:uncharacterized protein N7496_008521 [Penicillium cataractarum]KAJ5368761.1 hypothetical protein N7496_008521 [Penicillium cataractarum]
MPRPAPKRNRLTKGNKVAKSKSTEQPDQTDSNAAKSPPQSASEDPRRTLRSQTPLTQRNEHAIESSPTGERPGTGSCPGTGSRPPTRSRGYSSTLSFAGRKGDTSSRIPDTPGFENSVLRNFRRRPRQQSILQMMQAEDDTLELDDEDFLGGLSPEDESTPLHLSRGKSLLIRQDDQSQSPSESLPSSGGSRKRKRSDQIQVPQSLSVVITNTVVETIEDTPHPTPDIREPTPDVPDETPRPLRFAEILSQTMLPPDSSPMSSIATGPGSPGIIPQRGLAGKRFRDPAHMSTAVLQERLLPRRRQRPRRGRPVDQFDLPSDESDDGMQNAASGDEDELGYLPVRRSRRSGTSKPEPLGNARDKSKLNNQKQRKTRSKSAPAAKSTVVQKSTRRSRSRRSGDIDKENEQYLSTPSSPLSSPPDSEASESEAEVQPRRIMSEELRAAAAKFAEVDKWEMEFEDVSASEV